MGLLSLNAAIVSRWLVLASAIAAVCGESCHDGTHNVCVYVPDTTHFDQSCVALAADLSGEMVETHGKVLSVRCNFHVPTHISFVQLGRNVTVQFAPTHSFSLANGLCRDPELGSSDANTSQRLTIRFLPIAVDDGRHWWLLDMTFRLNEVRTHWRLDNYTLTASYPRKPPRYDTEAFMHKSHKWSGGEWGEIPVGHGFSCSRVVLPFGQYNASVVLTDLKVVAFSKLPGGGLREGLDELDIEFDKCPADEHFWGWLAAIIGGVVCLLALCCICAGVVYRLSTAGTPQKRSFRRHA